MAMELGMVFMVQLNYFLGLLTQSMRELVYFIIRGDKQVDLKEFRKNNHTRPLSFTSGNDLMAIMNLMPGSVTPFGVLNDKEIRVTGFIDKEFVEWLNVIGVKYCDSVVKDRGFNLYHKRT